jgi:hypothetical protein
LIDARMKLAPLGRDLALAGLGDLVREGIEAIVQLPTERRDLALAPLEVLQLDKQVAGVRGHRRRRIVGLRGGWGDSWAAVPSIG